MDDVDRKTERLRRERSFLVSLLIHVALFAVLLLAQSRLSSSPIVLARDQESAPRVRLVLPPPEVLKAMIGKPPTAQSPMQETIAPIMKPRLGRTPRDRISIGPPSADRARVLLLERDRDITHEPLRGGSGAVSQATRGGEPLSGEMPRTSGAESSGLEGERMSLPSDILSKERGSSASASDGHRSIASSFRRWQRSLEQGAGVGGDGDGGGGGSGAGSRGRQMGPLFFDPAGADFTVWINHFKNEVYRNWIVPQGALMGFKGKVELRFTLGRDGRMIKLWLVRSSGTTFLDRAAANALLGSRFLPLPDGYGPMSVTMGVAFLYNEDPRSS